MLQRAEFDRLATVVRNRTAVALHVDKTYFVEARLLPLARRMTGGSLSSLVAQLDKPGQDVLTSAVIEAILNNETLFFRDLVPFDAIQREILPRLRTARAATRRIRIWSAACSTGQEAYSIAMMLDEQRGAWDGWHFDIVATDVSASAVERARAGRYTQFEVQRGLSAQRLVRYFDQQDDSWVIAPRLRERMTFQRANLAQGFDLLGRFDIILCRNVLLYFDAATKVVVLDNLHRALAPDGALILGAAESPTGVTERFTVDPDCRLAYRPVPRAADGAAVVAQKPVTIDRAIA